MNLSLKALFVVMLVPAFVAAADTPLTTSSDRVLALAEPVQDEARIAPERSIWKPTEVVHDEGAASTTPVRWLRPPRSALLWLPGDTTWNNGTDESLGPRRQLEW